MIMTAIWHGTQQEGMELVTAIAHNCTCETAPVVKRCAAHEAFTHNQQWLDRLVFMRRIRDRLNREEYLR